MAFDLFYNQNNFIPYRRIIVIQTALICFLLLLPLISTAQSTAVLQGKIYNKFTGKPASVEYNVTSSGGEKGKGKSDINGEYQQTVKSGETYTFRFRSYNVLNQAEEVFIENTGKYYEKEHDFRVGVLEKGYSLFAVQGFENKTANKTASFTSLINEAKSLIKDNRSINLEIAVAYDESKVVKKAAAQNKANTKSKSKKGKGKEIEPPPSSVETTEIIQSPVPDAILQARKAALESSFTDAEKKQITFRTVIEGVQGGNTIIYVGEVKDPFQK